MPNDSENPKKLPWELVVAAAGLCLAILAYARPPDPAHPMHFDFLSHTLSLPLWVAFVAVLAVIAITAAITRRKGGSPTPRHILENAPTPAPTAVAARTPTVPSGAVPAHTTTPVPHADGLTIAPNPAGLRIDSPDDVSLQIGRHQSGNQSGFTITFINERLGAISHTGVLIDNAQSFNKGRQAYRDRAGYTAARVTSPDPIQASCSGRPMWLVRKEPSSPHLLAGDSNQSPMIWPDNDTSNVQKWRVSLSAYLQTVPVRAGDSSVRLRAMEFSVVVAWHMDENEFSVEAA